jgi:hypothetical protein
MKESIEVSTEATTGHIQPVELADYFAGELPEEREGIIEEHFSECDECTAQARQFRVFTFMWDDWTAKAHGEVYRRAAVDRALQAAQVQAKSEEWRERLRRWREQWTGRAEAAVRVIMEAPGKAARIVTDGFEALVRPEGRWRFALEPAPVPVLGAMRVRGQEVRPLATVALALGRPQARVAISGEVGEVEVRVDGWPPGQSPPLVLLVPMKEGGEPMVKELAEEQAGVLIARFEGVEPGDYLVAFEPIS